jgi:hypothetical protein
MAHQVLEQAPPWRPARGRDERVDRVRLGLLACWALTLAGVLLLGEHVVPLTRLDAAVSSGRVSEVHVSPGLSRGSTGYLLQTARWREGTHRYAVTVRAVAGPGRPAGGSSAVVHRDLAGRLRAESRPGADLRVLRDREQGVAPTEMLGRFVPGWVEWVRLTLYLGALALLVQGPEPWRARRWAWFWLMSLFGLQTLGVLAFLALSGPTPLVAHPRPGRRRFRSGWAFLVALALAGLGGS